MLAGLPVDESPAFYFYYKRVIILFIFIVEHTCSSACSAEIANITFLNFLADLLDDIRFTHDNDIQLPCLVETIHCAVQLRAITVCPS